MGLIFLRTHFPTWIPRASGLGQISDTHSNFPLQILNLINSTPHLSWTWGCFKYSISLSSYPQLNFIFFNSPLPFNQLSSQENKTQKKKRIHNSQPQRICSFFTKITWISSFPGWFRGTQLMQFQLHQQNWGIKIRYLCFQILKPRKI